MRVCSGQQARQSRPRQGAASEGAREGDLDSNAGEAGCDDWAIAHSAHPRRRLRNHTGESPGNTEARRARQLSA